MFNKVNSQKAKSFTGKTNVVKILFLSTVVFLFAASSLPAQDSAKSTTGKHKTKMKKEMKMDMNGMKDTTMQDNDFSITRTGVIDLTAIDENKDGNVYQCQMDYNVISDKPGRDPKCGMKLEKVSLRKAKANLMKAGFKVR